MLGMMMDTPLLVSAIARFAEKNHGNQEVVSVTYDNPRHRYQYKDAIRRSRQLANALSRLGVQPGDRIATLAWNDHRHLEAYFGVSGSGAVLHTINPRLFAEQIVFIINHASDRYILVDPLVLPLLEKLQDQITGVEGFIILSDEAHMPETSLPGALCYETLLSAETDDYEWPDLDENSASAICYTSGTTGDPKGVVYSHRATILHTYAITMPDVMGLSCRDSVLPIVPMFHVNAWGVPYAAPMVGAKLVMPGAKAGDGETLQDLIETEGVTMSCGVPTVWLALLDYLDQSGKTVSNLNRIVVGGAACPSSIISKFNDQHDVYVHCAWGMTETSPLGVYNTLRSGQENLPAAELAALQLKAGRGIFGIEMKIVDANGKELPWDGVAFGALKVRGSWVASGYFGLDDNSDTHDASGWFGTGDVATIDPDGFMNITDRTKDVIKSGGEWISSIALENIAMGHPQVAEAAVIGIAHSKWTERPLLVIVAREGEPPTRQEMLALFEGRIASWWTPDDVVFVDELPHTATGKVRKATLREQFAAYTLPETSTDG